MNLRKLEKKDAPLMLEWMHDEDVVKYMNTNFKEKTISDCEKFIVASENEKDNVNLAVVDENNEYMGTVSLKNINYNSMCAEFAITMRKCAMGKGFSKYGINEIINYGFNNINLKNIYWYVSKKNERAIKFYDKNNFTRVSYDDITKIDSEIDNNSEEYLWYLVQKN